MTARIPARLRAILAADPSAVDRVLGILDVPDCTAAVTGPDLAAPHFRRLLAGREVEALAVLALDRRRIPIDCEIVTVGSDGFTIVDPRQIYRWALTRPARRACAGIILAHNHPSGDPTPSIQDRDVTDRVARAGRVLGIPLLDHLVIGDGYSYTSLAAEGTLPTWSVPGPAVTG